MYKQLQWGLVCGSLLAPGWAQGEEEAAPADWGDWAEAVEAAEVPIFETKLYGFIDAYGEKVFHSPAGFDEAGAPVYQTDPVEYDVANLHVMVQGSIHQRYRYFLNLAAPGAGSPLGDEPIAVRNAWVELPIYGEYLKVRAGKIYRRFGLYNEILDAVPTFIGIEPPELFDKDHLMLTRTTNVMVFGHAPIGANSLSYTLTTGNDEKAGGSIPVGGDVFFDLGGMLRVGSSFYTSGGAAEPGKAVGEGSPRGGVLNWMAEDHFKVYGGYLQLLAGGVTLQVEGWRASHDAKRDPDSVLALADAGLNTAQMANFFVGGDPAMGVIEDVSYNVDTAYVRLGYDLAGKAGGASFTPYLQGDFYRNPETIEAKSMGGDGEAGLSDDGQFLKYTAGIVIRPVPQVALKLDGSAHQITYGGERAFYPEGRISLSYLWQLD